MSHWDRKLAGEIVNLVRDISVDVTDSGRKVLLREVEGRAMAAERTHSTDAQDIAILLGEVCTACLGDGLSTCSGKHHCSICSRGKTA